MFVLRLAIFTENSNWNLEQKTKPRKSSTEFYTLRHLNKVNGEPDPKISGFVGLPQKLVYHHNERNNFVIQYCACQNNLSIYMRNFNWVCWYTSVHTVSFGDFHADVGMEIGVELVASRKSPQVERPVGDFVCGLCHFHYHNKYLKIWGRVLWFALCLNFGKYKYLRIGDTTKINVIVYLFWCLSSSLKRLIKFRLNLAYEST